MWGLDLFRGLDEEAGNHFGRTVLRGSLKILLSLVPGKRSRLTAMIIARFADDPFLALLMAEFWSPSKLDRRRFRAIFG